MGAAALSSLWNPNLIGSAGAASGLPGFLIFRPKQSEQYLFFPGGPSHIDLFDYKPSVKYTVRITRFDKTRTTNNWNDEWSEIIPCVAPMFGLKNLASMELKQGPSSLHRRNR